MGPNLNPFAGYWFLLMALVIAGGLAVHYFLRNKPFEYKREVLMGLSILLTFFLLAVAVFLIDLVLRAVINPTANFFFPFDPEGSFIFEFLWGLIHIPLVYQMPLLVLITPVLLLQYAIYRGIHRLTHLDEPGQVTVS